MGFDYQPHTHIPALGLATGMSRQLVGTGFIPELKNAISAKKLVRQRRKKSMPSELTVGFSFMIETSLGTTRSLSRSCASLSHDGKQPVCSLGDTLPHCYYWKS